MFKVVPIRRRALIFTLAAAMLAGGLLSAGTAAAHALPPQTGTVGGYITDAATNDPISGADVTVRTGQTIDDTVVTVTTDGDGYYEAELPYGGTFPTVSAIAAGYGPLQDVFSALSAGSPTATVDLALRAKDASASGVVRDAASGDPIVGADLSFSYAWDVENVVSIAGGVYSLPAAVADEYQVEASAAGYLTQRIESVLLVSGEDYELDVDLVAADAILAGRVTDGSGNGIEGLEVHGQPTGQGSPYLSGMTDADGYYEIPGFGAGSWDVSVGGPSALPDNEGGFWVEQTRVVVLPAGETTTQNFQLEPLLFGAISGHVYDADSNPLAGICVLIVDPDTGDIVTVVGGMSGTGSDGWFQSTEVPVGINTIMFWDCGQLGDIDAYAVGYLGDVTARGLADTFDLEEDEVIENLNVQMTPGGSISGVAQVRTPDGSAPLPGERILTVRPQLYQKVAGEWEQIYYDNPFFGFDDGYLMVGLPPGELCVGFVDSSGGPRAFSPSYYGDADSCDGANLVTVTAGDLVEDLVALLTIPRPGFAAAAITSFDNNPAGGIGSESELTQGETTTIDVGAEYAGEWLATFGHSTPTPFGDWYQVSSTGTITATVPTSLAAGSHSLVVQDATGQVIGWNAVTVVAAPGTGGTDGAVGSGLKSGVTTTYSIAGGATTTTWTLQKIIDKFGADAEELLLQYFTATDRAVPPTLLSLIAAGGGDGLDLGDFGAWLTWSGNDKTVEVWAYSTPTFLGRFPVVDGVAQLAGLDLAALGEGAHHLLIIGSQSGSYQVGSFEVPIQAAPSSAPVAAGSVDSDRDPVAAAPGDAGGFPFWLILVGAAVVIGAMVLVLTRSRRT